MTTSFPKEEIEKLNAISRLNHVKKGDFFLKEGDKPDNFAFVYEGLFRITYLHEKGKEFTKGFFPENSFISSYSALIQNRESYFSIEAIENSTIIIIDYNKFKQLFESNNCWHILLIALLEKAFCIKEAREREFLLFNATQRYESFLENYPQLEGRLKQHVLASYLGITPVALSNLRKRKR